jgi:hypothetical protein
VEYCLLTDSIWSMRGFVNQADRSYRKEPMVIR